MINHASRTRWYWPGVLTIPAVGMVAQQVWTFHGLSLDGSPGDQLRSAVGWAGWVAAPFVVVGASMALAVRRRSRAAWWVAVIGGAATVLQGLLLIVLAAADPSTDPLVGLYQVLTPLVQLGPAVASGVAVLVLVLVAAHRARPDSATPTVALPQP